MSLWCRWSHGKFREDLLRKTCQTVWSSRQNEWIYQYSWEPFVHCAKCHDPLLKEQETYSTPDEVELHVRQKMLEESLKASQ